MKRRVFVVDGIDGSGKSHASRMVAAACTRHGARAALLHVDDFRRPVQWKQPPRPEHQVYYEEYFDFPHMEAVVQEFLGGAVQVRIPVYDSSREVLEGTQDLHFRDAQVLVVEGVLVRNIPAVRAAPGLYLRTSRGEARRRIMERDLKKGRTLEEIERRIGQRYFPAQDRYLAEHTPEAAANAVLDNEYWEEPRLLRLSGALAPAESLALQSLFIHRAVEAELA